MSVPSARLDDRDDPWADAAERQREEEEDDMRDDTPRHLRTPIAHLAHAIRPYLSDPRKDGRFSSTGLALEVARNVAAVVEMFEVADALDEMLRHRVRHGWLAVGDLESAVVLGAAAWRRAVEQGAAAGGEQREAA